MVAPYSISMRTASALPLLAQVISGVSPVATGVFGLALDFKSARTNAEFPLMQASDNGVVLKSVAVLASAPAASSRLAVSNSFQCASQSSAVEPSLARELMSAFW